MNEDVLGAMPHQAAFWHPEGDALRCDLCPRRCVIKPGSTGFCGTRRNVQGTMFAINYGKVCVSAVDPIEKKPIFHFHPGSRIYSLGTFGCNLDCGNCQNFVLARSKEGESPCTFTSPEEVASAAKEKGVAGVAWTFNEPTVWIEFIMDTARLLRKQGMFSILNTNGYIESWAAEDFYDLADAANIDVKGFTESFYKSKCNGKLEPILEACLIAKDAGVHVELTNLLIPGLNDSAAEMKRLFDWVAQEMGEDTPMHLFRFMPYHRFSDLPEESMEKMEEAYRIAKESGLRYIYFAGVRGHPKQNTYCPNCGQLLINRSSQEATESTFVRQEKMSRFCPTYTQVQVHLQGGRCPKCAKKIPVVL